MSLKICLIGKYFPIQGGVSKDNVWLTSTLAQAGFHMHIVTNAEEVEPQYRCLPWSPFPALPEGCPGSIAVHTTSKAERRHYVPYANPYVTKLAGIATEVIRTYQCDLIYSYYLEPYALAAYLASQWTGVPYGLRHAGSDIGALFQSPELQPTYREIILASDYLVATPATYRGFLHLGVPLDKLYVPAGICFPSGVFTPDAEPLDVNALLGWMQEHLPPDPYYDAFRRLAQKPFHPEVPTIGIYGKIGAAKGSFDLLHALGHLRREGIAFQFLALTQGSTAALQEFTTSLEEQGLAEATWLLPFLPHWSVPQFIRACTAICFLERDFPFAIHTPLIPLDVLSCGTCLVLSHEIAAKQPHPERLQHQVNVFLVDPLNHAELAATLRTIVHDPIASQQVGRNGFHAFGRKPSVGIPPGQAWQRLFVRIYNDIQDRRQVMSLAEMQSYLARLYTDDSFRRLFTLAPEASFEHYWLTDVERQALQAIDQRLLEYFATSLKIKQQEYLRAAYPATFALPQALMQHFFHRFYQDCPAKPHEDPLTRIRDFGIFLEQALACEEQAPCYASEVVKYERLHYLTTYQPRAEDALAALNTSPAKSVPFHSEAVPVLCPGIHREMFVYPVVTIIEALLAGQALEAIVTQPRRCELVFQREERTLTVNVFELNAETALLLDLCQGAHTVATLIETVEQQLGETDLADDILAMLRVLQEKHILGVRDGR